jgi:hypothetical protein
MEYEHVYLQRPRETRGRKAAERDRRARDRRGKRVECHGRVAADAAPAHGPHHKLIERGLNGDRCGGVIAATVADVAAALDRGLHPVLRRLLHQLDRTNSALLASPVAVRALGYLAGFRSWWIRRPDEWTADPSLTTNRQLGNLLRHVLCRFPVPASFDWAWTAGAADPLLGEVGRAWMVHVGSGHSIRTAAGLPFALSRAMAHAVMLAPDDLTLPQALRYGQFAGRGVDARLARAVAGTALGRRFDVGGADRVVMDFLLRQADTRPNQVGPIVDYVIARRLGALGQPPQPNFTLGRRDVRAVMREIGRWHAMLQQVRDVQHATWRPCGVAWFQRDVSPSSEPGRATRWRIVELLSSAELIDEGRAMHHCVASYAHLAAGGRTAIFSVRRCEADRPTERAATLEVYVPERLVVQLRGPCNQRASATVRQLVAAWAADVGLTIAATASAD